MAFVFLCIYLFFLFVRPQDWFSLQLAILRPILLTQVLAIIFTTIELATGHLKLPSLKQPWWWIMTGLLIGVAFSHLGNFYISGAISASIIFGKTYLTFILIWINLNSIKRLEIFSVFMVTMATFIAIHCVLLHETGKGFGNSKGLARKIGEDATDVDSDAVIQAQFYGIFSDPNDTAQIIVAAIPLTIFLVLRIPNFVFKISVLGLVAIQILGVLATESRGGFLALAATCFVALRGFFRPIYFIMISIFSVALFPIFAPARFKGGMIDDSSSDRVAYWGEATTAFRSNPLFGIGYSKVSDYTSTGLTVHNSYIEAYAELGIFGYTFWFVAFVFAFYSMLRLSKVLPESKEEGFLVTWIKCIVPCLAGCYVAAFFLSRAYAVPIYVIFAMTAACYGISSQKIGSEVMNLYCRISEKYLVRWVGLALASIAFIYCSIRVLNTIT